MSLSQQAATITPPGYDVTTWDTSELLPEPSEAVIAVKLERLHAAVDAFEQQREHLAADRDPGELLSMMRQYEDLITQMNVVWGYAHLWFCSNTQDSAALAFRSRMQRVIAQIENRILFFTLWWKGLDDAAAERLLPPAGPGPDAKAHDFRHYLRELRLFSPYTLDERSEQIINLKNTNGIEAVITLYSMLIHRLEFHLEVDGEPRTLTDDEMRSLFFSPDPDLRAAVYQEMFRVYEADSKILAQIYANRVRDWYTDYVELRGVGSPIAMRNLTNDIPDAAVETLLEVVHRNAPIFQEYFRLKAQWLGMDRLRRYDLYAPLANSSRRVSYREAAATVLDTFYQFDDCFGRLAEKVFAENHIDGEIRKGKRGGAVCITLLPQLTPWVLINFAGRVRDIANMAHELGHAVHSMLAAEHSLLVQHPSLPLAETASVFAEMLITDRLLANEDDPMTRRELLAAAVDDIYAAVMRQAYFVRFEIAAHEAVMANRSADELSELYLSNLHEQFGDSMDISEEFRYEWVSIHHMFNTPFYCYAYSFGQLLVLALYRRYQQEGAAFKPGYLRLLSSGGSASPQDLLAEVGIDMTDANFWQEGFEVVRGMIDELKSIKIR